MFITNLTVDFYDKIKEDRALIFVNYDVDAVCSCRILQYLFQCDNIIYTLVPVYDKKELVDQYKRHGDQVKSVILINIGANFNIVDLLAPEADVVFYVVDSHRPFDIYNVYNEDQIVIIAKNEDQENIPEYADLFIEEEDEDLDDESKITPELVEKRRERRLWIEKRHKILFDYQQFSFQGCASAMMMFSLAWGMSKDNNDLLWWAIVGLSQQYLHKKLDDNSYLEELGTLQNHVSRHNNWGTSEVTAPSVSCLKVTFDKELKLFLYKHWTLMESIKHSIYTCCTFRLWTNKGTKKLYEFLADMGLPLAQTKQKFASMDLTFRNNIMQWIEEMSGKYSLDKIVFGSFVANYGFKNSYCASDFVFAVDALLESTEQGLHSDKRFWDALDCLSRSNNIILERGIELAKKRLIAVFKQIYSLIDMNQIIVAGPFLYTTIQKGNADLQYFSYPNSLVTMANFLLQAYCSKASTKKFHHLPLVLVSPYEKTEYSLVVGVPPLSEDSLKNFFGKAFEQVGEVSQCQIMQEFADGFVIKLKASDRPKFFDALISLLT